MTEICEKKLPNAHISQPRMDNTSFSKFQFNARQKQLLYKYLIEGEETGNK